MVPHGAGDVIPPNSDLIFEFKIIDVLDPNYNLISSDELKNLLDNNAVVLDIRTDDQWKKLV